MRYVRLIPIVATVVLALAAPARANLIANGNFNTPSPAGLDSWTAIFGPSTVYGLQDADYTGCCGGYGSSPNGTFAAFSAGSAVAGASISQTVSLLPGVDYVLGFQYGAFGGSLQQISVDITGQPTRTFTSGPPTSDLSTLFGSYGFNFDATAALTTITFTDTGFQYNSSSTDGFLTSVDLSLPEPSSLPMLLAGLGLMGAAFYFGRKKGDCQLTTRS